MKKSNLLKNRQTKSYKIFLGFNYVFLWAVAILCVLPVIHVFAISLSARHFADAGLVRLLPKGFTVDAYLYVFKDNMFFNSLKISIFRVVLGVSFNLLITILIAYPMSKAREEFSGRRFFLTVIVITMFFNGGLIPTFLLIRRLGLYDNPLVYVIPGGVNTYFALLTMNFFRQLPKEIEEAAKVDGCDYFRTLRVIVLPLSKPVLATVTLYAFVGHWNSWFDGLVYSSSSENYPLQTLLYQMLNTLKSSTMTQAEAFERLGGASVSSAQIFITTLPIMVTYPFLQKYFVKGIVLGSVKG